MTAVLITSKIPFDRGGQPIQCGICFETEKINRWGQAKDSFVKHWAARSSENAPLVSHCYHKSCLEKWLNPHQIYGTAPRNICPDCRVPFTQTSIDYVYRVFSLRTIGRISQRIFSDAVRGLSYGAFSAAIVQPIASGNLSISREVGLMLSGMSISVLCSPGLSSGLTGKKLHRLFSIGIQRIFICLLGYLLLQEYLGEGGFFDKSLSTHDFITKSLSAAFGIILVIPDLCRKFIECENFTDVGPQEVADATRANLIQDASNLRDRIDRWTWKAVPWVIAGTVVRKSFDALRSWF